jgi:hypothetical protein
MIWPTGCTANTVSVQHIASASSKALDRVGPPRSPGARCARSETDRTCAAGRAIGGPKGPRLAQAHGAPVACHRPAADRHSLRPHH